MNVSRSLTFLGTPWTIATSVVVVLFTAGFCFMAWRRASFRPSVGLLELLRFLLVATVAVLFNQPEWIEEFRPEEKPAIAVLWDASASMETRDVLPQPGETTKAKDGGGRGSPDPAQSPTEGLPRSGSIAANSAPTTRREAITLLQDPAAWNSLRDRMNVIIQPFSEPKAGHGTDLNEPLTRALEKVPSLRGIVLASDGDWNEGSPPVQAAARLRMRSVPIFAVPVGSRTRLPDVELLSLDLPTFGIAGKAVRIPFSIESSLPRDYLTTVSARASDGEEVSKEVRVAAMTRTSDYLVWRPKTTGDFTLTVTVPKHAAETLADNNKLTAPISIREEKLRVLVVESYPRWEYRYLRNALSRDPGVELSCLLFHPGLSKVGGGNKDYIKQFPSGRDELTKFDVVFLGDVGLEDNQLTTEQCRLLKGLVEHQASGLVFMPGWQGRQFSLLGTELADLYPVLMDQGQPNGWGSRTANHFELTEVGRRSHLTKLADTEDDNAEVWEGLPGFQWYAPVLRAKAGSEVLCVHKDASNEFGRLPLLVTRTMGAGKVLFMGTDGAWRWRKGVEDKYHYRFWGQVVRWMAYQRNMAKGETMRLYYVPDQPKLHQTVALHTNVMDKTGEPLHGGEVTARITAPSGKSELVRFTSAGDEWGEFSGRFMAEEAGTHRVSLFCKETGATLDASFFVQGAAIEPMGKPARPEVMEELARVTGGKVLGAGKLDQVVEALAALPDPPPLVHRLPLWCHPVVAAILVTLLGAFWVGRKVIGLV
jgi:hypothetical protein